MARLVARKAVSRTVAAPARAAALRTPASLRSTTSSSRRYVTTMKICTRRSSRNTYPSSASVPGSAQCTSSITTMSGLRNASRASAATTPWKYAVSSPSAGAGFRPSTETRPRARDSSGPSSIANGKYGRASAGSHRPAATVTCSPRRSHSSATRRVLPEPRSPSSITMRAQPSRTSRNSVWRKASKSRRPTKASLPIGCAIMGAAAFVGGAVRAFAERRRRCAVPRSLPAWPRPQPRPRPPRRAAVSGSHRHRDDDPHGRPAHAARAGVRGARRALRLRRLARRRARAARPRHEVARPRRRHRAAGTHRRAPALHRRRRSAARGRSRARGIIRRGRAPHGRVRGDVARSVDHRRRLGPEPLARQSVPHARRAERRDPRPPRRAAPHRRPRAARQRESDATGGRRRDDAGSRRRPHPARRARRADRRVRRQREGSGDACDPAASHEQLVRASEAALENATAGG